MMHYRENVESENVLSSLVSRASTVLDELQSLMSQIYQIKDADTSKESDDESAKSTSSGGSSYWWDDSFNSLVSCHGGNGRLVVLCRMRELQRGVISNFHCI